MLWPVELVEGSRTGKRPAAAPQSMAERYVHEARKAPSSDRLRSAIGMAARLMTTRMGERKAAGYRRKLPREAGGEKKVGGKRGAGPRPRKGPRRPRPSPGGRAGGRSVFTHR